MKSIMAANDSSSFSRRYFNCANTKQSNHNDDLNNIVEENLINISCIFPKPNLSLFKLFANSSLGSKVVGTLFGHRRGHVHIAFQEVSTSAPAFLVELSTPTSVLVREMASGLVKVALECDKTSQRKKKKILEEPLWRAYCNGKKCGYAMRRECGAHEWRVLRSVGPISMGAGVLPGNVPSVEGEVMYMRAKFERVVGSKDCEAFYMMNPDGNGGPELSVYLLRV